MSAQASETDNPHSNFAESAKLEWGTLCPDTPQSPASGWRSQLSQFQMPRVDSSGSDRSEHFPTYKEMR